MLFANPSAWANRREKKQSAHDGDILLLFRRGGGTFLVKSHKKCLLTACLLMPHMSWGLVVVFSRPSQHSQSKMPKHLPNVDVKTPNTYVRVCFCCPWASRYQYYCNKLNYRIMSTSVAEVRSAALKRVYVWQRGSKHGIYTSSNGPLSWRAVWLLLALATFGRANTYRYKYHKWPTVMPHTITSTWPFPQVVKGVV